MDRIMDWIPMVRKVIEAYATAAYKAKSYYIEDNSRQLYTVLTVPNHDYPIDTKPGVIILSRIVDDLIVIEQDNTDRPLYEELLRNGIPREQIILAYAGETIPEA